METSSLFLYALLGASASFIGTLPVGPINISVVYTTLNENLTTALRLAFAAALVEIGQSFLAIHCGHLINSALDNDYVKYALIVLFLVIGVLFLLKKNKSSINPDEEARKKKNSPFVRGLLIAALNPQALPFWVFVLTFLQSTSYVSADSFMRISALLVFLLGVSIGKWLALALYGYLSVLISKRLTTITQFMNKIIGGIFLVLGVVQLVKVLT
ncbi:MAG: LysE family transporter [Bacteroidota bacterium]